MALGITVIKRIPFHPNASGGFRFAIVDFVGDAAYATGGYLISSASTPSINAIFPSGAPATIVAVCLAGANAPTANFYIPYWDQSTSKLRFIKGAAGPLVEAGAAEGTVNGAKFRALVIGF